MNRRFLFKKSKGQSIPLIALIIVILFAMVGLSVDVGNTYAQQRDLVRATNAASMAGMETYIRGGEFVSDSDVADAIIESFASNGITIVDKPAAELAPGERRMVARYMGADGNAHLGCPVGQCLGDIPDDVSYIEINIEGLVDTYFARVVGRQNLPVNTTSYAAKCLPSDNVFPIAIYEKHIDGTRFSDPGDGTYNAKGFVNAEYPTGLPTRKLFIEKSNPGNFPNGFSWLRWTRSQNQLQPMLSGFGNLKDGFEEVTPWPDQNVPQPDNYPLTPGELSPNDWIYNLAGNKYNQTRSAMSAHISNQSQMILPIISKSVRINNNLYAYQFTRLGLFYAVDHGRNYVELAYAGPAKQTVCLRTPPDRPTDVGLQGDVFVKPRWSDDGPPRPPIHYQVVLDVSGSMSWDFSGYGTSGGRNYMCENPNNPNPSGLPYKNNCNGGISTSWHVVEERRVYIAKQAINELIDNMDTGDVMRVIAYSSGNNVIGRANAKAYPTDGLTGDKTKLKEAVRQAGIWTSNDPYRTRGGTPGAQGMRATGQLLEQAPTKAPDGREYKEVIIYLTDGVANVFLNGRTNTARDICGHMGSTQAINTPNPCQLGVTNNGTLRPITALINEATKIRQSNSGMDIYVVAMGPADDTGLGQVASQPSMLYLANTPGVVDDIFRLINNQAENRICRAHDADFTSDLSGQNSTGLPGFPAPSDGHGYVTIRDAAGSVLPDGQGRLPIVYDPAIGKLVYRIPPEVGIAPGDYSIEAYVNYEGPDGKTRTYRWMVSIDDPDGKTSRSFSVPPNAFGSIYTMNTIFLDLAPDDGVCPTAPNP